MSSYYCAYLTNVNDVLMGFGFGAFATALACLALIKVRR